MFAGIIVARAAALPIVFVRVERDLGRGESQTAAGFDSEGDRVLFAFFDTHGIVPRKLNTLRPDRSFRGFLNGLEKRLYGIQKERPRAKRNKWREGSPEV